MKKKLLTSLFFLLALVSILSFGAFAEDAALPDDFVFPDAVTEELSEPTDEFISEPAVMPADDTSASDPTEETLPSDAEPEEEVLPTVEEVLPTIEPEMLSAPAPAPSRFMNVLKVFIPGFGVADDQQRINAEVKPNYSAAEAKSVIDGILAGYSPSCSVAFGGSGVHISNSYMVDSRYDRQKISTIIRNTGLTDRSVLNLAAEWKMHNIAYALNFMVDSARDADLDYAGDARWYVSSVVRVMELIKWI